MKSTINQQQPTIILGMPADNSIYKMVENNLKHHGFHVINVVLNNREFRYPSFFSRVSVKLKQIILRDKEAKRKLQSHLLQKSVSQKIKEIGKIDYALFIRGDIYTPDFLSFIKKHIRYSMVNYQWDGIGRFPYIQNCISQFDKFYTFDPADLSDSRLLPTTNFYFDHNINLPETPTEGLYFVGFHSPQRIEVINRFANLAHKANLKLNFSIGGLDIDPQVLRNQYPKNIHTFIGIRTFEENLHAAQQAEVLVDFKTAIHNGLSFRPFEALGYRKKLITNHPDIKKYDFYHPNNIFVWNGENFDGLQEFLAKPYHELPAEIYEKYSFGNWIRYVLDIQPHHKITLPK